MSDSIICELRNNLDSVVILFTESGCFTGLLVEVDDTTCKIISRAGASHCGFGRVTVCRLNAIDAVTFCNTCC